MVKKIQMYVYLNNACNIPPNDKIAKQTYYSTQYVIKVKQISIQLITVFVNVDIIHME